MGAFWKNGELIRRAEEDGYEVIVTTDQNIQHQQNLAECRLGIVVLMATAWPRVQHRIEEIRAAINEVGAGQVREVPIPRQVPDE